MIRCVYLETLEAVSGFDHFVVVYSRHTYAINAIRAQERAPSI
jgi:hypothetical protein